MPVDKNKVNKILLEFQQLLKQEKPSLEELKLVSNKILSLITRLEAKQKVRQPKIKERGENYSRPPDQPAMKWYRIPID